MSDIIHLLPDHIANQIAAGEVVQRPASVVKELLENALDAGCTSVRLIVKDAGKTSIQVIDDGIGMTETDARMAFERHATSKIKKAEDLFSIKTMGFRGEALASIAAIAHVELITRQASEELATRLVMEGSVSVIQEKTQAFEGTSITVKNLFYNVPARRKFLKSDAVELKHITEEFYRVALANPNIHFSLFHNGNELFHLPKGTLKQRIVSVFGKPYAEKLVAVQENAEVVSISGFVGKADAAKKSQTEQYIFVNQRFVKSHYLNHAIRSAYEEIISSELYPVYFLFLEIDPATIDVNVHPTKTEIKFEEERLIYNYLKVAIKHSLGQYTLGSMIDFSQSSSFPPFTNPSSMSSSDGTTGPALPHRPSNAIGWEQVYKGLTEFSAPAQGMDQDLFSIQKEASALSPVEETGIQPSSLTHPVQLHQSYILHQVRSGLLVIDQQAAHERILYEYYLDILQSGEYTSQKELFPRTIQLDPVRAELLKNMLSQLHAVGFELEDFGHNSFILHGTPAGLYGGDSVEVIIDKMIEQYSSNLELQLGVQENMARSLSFSAGIKRGRRLEKEEMQRLTDQLFGCQMPYKSPSGRKCFYILELDELSKRFTS